MKIANKISVLFFATSLILMIVAGAIFYRFSKDSLRKSIDNNLATACCFRSDHIKTYLKMLEISVGQLSKSVVLENFLLINGKENPQQGEAFEQAMKRLKRTKEANLAISEFLLLDKTGKVAASSNESSIGLDYSTDAFFLGGQKKTYIKDVYYSESHKDYLMAVSAPLLDSQNGEFLGELVSWVRLTDLNNITASEIGMGKTGEIYIVNKYGLMITPSRFKEDAVLKQKVNTENVRRAWLHKGTEHLLSQDKLADVFSSYRGVQVLGAHEYIPRMQWSVLAEIDVEEAFRPLRIIRLVFLVVIFLVAIAAWLLGIFIAGLITGPIHRLHKGTEIIGSGNLGYKVGTNAKDEVGRLSRSFDIMTENLRQVTVSINTLNKEITERKKAEEALVKSENKFRILFESSRDAIMILESPSWMFTSGNPATVQMFKTKDEAEFISYEPWVLSPERQPDGRASVEKAKEMIEIAMRDGSNFFEWTHKRLNDEEFSATVLLTRMVLAEKTILQATVRDITDRKREGEELRVTYKKLKQAQQELIQSSKMAAMGQLAAGISHELNQPLTGIKGFAQAVLMDLEKESPFRKDLNKIVAQVDRMDMIIKNVRFFARKSDFNNIELDINQVILNSLMLLSQQFKVHNIRVIQELSPDIPKIQGDPNQLQQVFLNIISNARDAILGLNRPEGGEIRVRTSLSQDKKHIEINFQDTGCGIPDGNLQHIFSPFFTTKSPDKGMGLGLSIAYRIIENHQGKIEFKSKEGQGTTFNIVFPLQGTKHKIKQS